MQSMFYAFMSAANCKTEKNRIEANGMCYKIEKRLQ